MSGLVESNAERTTISVHTEPPGLVIRVRGGLDDRGLQLLREVARAALVTVKHARHIHLDLQRVEAGRHLPRVIDRLERAGAVVTPPLAQQIPSTPNHHAWSAP
jgi:hypothetical protein